MNKQQAREWFKAEVTRRLIELGAEKVDASYPYKLQTIAGPLLVSPEDDWVACRWADLALARTLVTDCCLNPYSGKWNFIYNIVDRQTAHAAVGDFFRQLGRYIGVSDENV